ncbi:MAG TPA: hypothetical protein VGG02_00535 [Chthoniobacterales bacterium]|jgi:hypothetical protein
MKRLTPNEIDIRDAKDMLENEVTKTYAMLEIVSLIPQMLRNDSFTLDIRTLDGLEMLATEQGQTLSDRFDDLTAALDKSPARKAGRGRKS